MKRLRFLAIFFVSTVICATTPAQTIQKNNPQTSFIGPRILAAGKLLSCEKTSHSSTCLTAAAPPDLGEIIGIVPLNRQSDSTVYWELVTQKTVAVCGLNFKDKKAACSPISDLHAALSEASRSQHESAAEIIERYQPQFNAAIRVVSNSIGDKAITDKSPTTSFRPLEQVDDGGGGVGGGDAGGGGGGDGGDVPVVVVVGTPDNGSGDDGGGDDSGGSESPSPVPTEPSPLPGASNNDSPARAKCMASAYAVWLIEDAVCRSQKNYRDYLACNDYNWGEYNTSRKLCEEQFP